MHATDGFSRLHMKSKSSIPCHEKAAKPHSVSVLHPLGSRGLVVETLNSCAELKVTSRIRSGLALMLIQLSIHLRK